MSNRDVAENTEDWIIDEMQSCDFGDKRLDRRALIVLKTLAQTSEGQSLYSLCASRDEAKATYRFFNNNHISPQQLIAPHIESTLERCKNHKVILHIQDTTELNFSQREEIPGMGKLRYDDDQGMFFHPTLAVTTTRVCLGAVKFHTFTRKEILTESAAQKQKTQPIEQKESYRWVESHLHSIALAAKTDSQTLINIADREGDFYESLCVFPSVQSQAAAQEEHRAHFIVRAKSHRNPINAETQYVDGEADSEREGVTKKRKIIDVVRETPVLERIQFDVPDNHKGRSKRTVTQEVRALSVTIAPPKHLRDTHSPIYVTAIVATETNPPEGEKAIEWMLFTSLGLNASYSVAKIIEYYLARWEIELYFKTLKSGCNITRTQLKTYDRIAACMAMCAIVAWRINMIAMFGRELPDAPCTTVYTEREWKAALVMKSESVPEKPPSVQTITNIIATFGGFKKSKTNPYPGTKNIWRGLYVLENYITALLLVGAIPSCG